MCWWVLCRLVFLLLHFELYDCLIITMDINSKDASNTIRTTYIESMETNSKDAPNAIRITYIESKGHNVKQHTKPSFVLYCEC